MTSCRILVAKKDTVGARKSFEKAVALNPSYMSAVASLASMDMAENKPDDARKRFETVLTSNPKNSTALLALAKLTLATGGKPEDALALITRAVSGNPSEVRPRLALIEFHTRAADRHEHDDLQQDGELGGNRLRGAAVEYS